MYKYSTIDLSLYYVNVTILEAPAETESQTTWLAHRLQFEREPTKPTSEGVEEPESLPLDASALSGAQASEQFYALDDPRNPLNVRRREGGTAAAGSRGVGGGLKRDGEKRDHGHSSHKKTKT